MPSDSSTTDETQPVAAPQPAAQAPAPAVDAGGKGINFKGEFDIYPHRPLPLHAHEPLQAFAARSKKNANAFAVLCQKYLVPRLELTHKYMSLQHDGMPRLLGSGVVDWTPDLTQHYGLLFENLQGEPLVKDESNVALGWKEEFVRHAVLKSLIPTLQDLRYSELPHGGIRLSNIFTQNGRQAVPGQIDKLILGECLSLPCGYAQPAIYLPIEKILCHPAARGDGSYEDDMYALGVCLALLLRTTDPNIGATPREIFERKVEHGSFITIIGKSRINGIILELIRGLLQDDPQQRWTLEDVTGWIDGRRVAPKAAGITGKNKASRPMKFIGKEFTRPTLLAAAMTDHMAEAVHLIESGELDNWIHRSLEDKSLAKRVDLAMHSAQDQMVSAGYQERLVILVATALAPNLPINYKGNIFTPDGFGRLLVHYYATPHKLNLLAEIIRYRLINGWLDHGDVTHFDVGILQQRLMICNNSIRQTASGHGLERCAYTLVPEAPCLSEKFHDYYLRSADDLLGAIEGTLTAKKTLENPFDRHVTAFMLARDHSAIDNSLLDLSNPEAHRRQMAIMRSLQRLQTRLKDSRFPQTTNWLVSGAQALIDRFHDRDHRQKIKDSLEKVRSNGEIKVLLNILDDPQQKQSDQHEFRNAMVRFQYLKREFTNLEYNLANDPKFGFGTGREMAATVAGIICFIVIGIMVLMKFTQDGKLTF